MIKCNSNMKGKRWKNGNGGNTSGRARNNLTTSTINDLWMWFLQTIIVGILLVQCGKLNKYHFI